MVTTTRSSRPSRSASWGLAGAALLLGVLHAGCETDEPTDVQSYTDSAGRSCSVDLADITLVASCDADPGALVSCEVGQEPAFVLHDDYDFDTMITTRRSCPACIDRAARMTYVASSCATVQCTADADCLNRDGDVRPFPCAAGICTR